MKKINTTIIDDHDLFAEGVMRLLTDSDKISLNASFKSFNDLIEKSTPNAYDVILLDINLELESGIDVCSRIKSSYPEVKIIALTMVNELSVIRKMINNGVDGYLLKNVDKEELELAIVEVYSGNQYFGRNTKHIIYQNVKPPHSIKNGDKNPTLSRREKEVLELIVEEYTTQEIADALHISFSTVETHRRNLSIKLGVRNTAGLVRTALEKGLI